MELYDNEASIKIVTPQGDRLLIKHEIREVQVVNENVVKLGASDPMKHFFIRHSEITEPETADVWDLQELLFEWIETCACVQGAAS